MDDGAALRDEQVDDGGSSERDETVDDGAALSDEQVDDGESWAWTTSLDRGLNSC